MTTVEHLRNSNFAPLLPRRPCWSTEPSEWSTFRIPDERRNYLRGHYRPWQRVARRSSWCQKCLNPKIGENSLQFASLVHVMIIFVFQNDPNSGEEKGVLGRIICVPTFNRDGCARSCSKWLKIVSHLHEVMFMCCCFIPNSRQDEGRYFLELSASEGWTMFCPLERIASFSLQLGLPFGWNYKPLYFSLCQHRS